MRIPQSSTQKIKAGIHWVQALLIFIGGCLSLATLTKDGNSSGGVLFYFGLCWLTIPALIYQVMVPQWTRARRFANVYAYAALDILFALMWLAAFASVAAWETEGVAKGTKSSKGKEAGSCSHFAYGSGSKCTTAKASIGFGVLMFVTFSTTSGMSVHDVIRYLKTGVLPSAESKTPDHQSQVADSSRDPWSTSIDDFDFQRQFDGSHAYDPVPQNSDKQHLLQRPPNNSQRKDSHVSLNPHHNMIDTLTEDGAHPGRLVTFSSNESLSLPLDGDEEYDSTSPGYVAPSAFSPSPWTETHGRVRFPDVGF